MIKKTIGLKVLVLPLSLGLVVILAVLFIKPAISDMAAAKRAVDEDKGQLADLQSQNAKLLTLKSKWEAMDEDKRRVQNALPENKDIDNYLNELYGRASRSGVLLKNFDVLKGGSSDQSDICGGGAGALAGVSQAGANTAVPSDAAASSGSAASSSAATSPVISRPCVNSADVNISASGNWDQLLSLLSYLGDTNRVANIRILSISSAGEGKQEEGNSDVLSIGITLRIFDKAKDEMSDIGTINALASQGTFNEEIVSRLKNTIYSIYEEPSVSETGERNIFK